MITSYTIGLALAAAVLLAAVLWLIRRRKSQPDTRSTIRSVSVDRLDDVLVPDGMGGQIHVEHLLLTTKGLVVVDVREVEGVVFASDRMNDWTVIGKRGRFAFPNPQGTLYDRVAAVKQLARDVPVSGHVLFAAGADFSKGRPKNVLLPGEMLEIYRKPERRDIERLTVAFAPSWESVREAVEPARRSG